MNKGSKWVLAAGVVSFLIAVYVWFMGDKDAGLFVGLWVPSLFALASYLKK